MQAGSSKPIVWIANQIPTLLVLGALGAIGYWGAVHDWTIPKFSALFSNPPRDEEKSVIQLAADPASQSSSDHCTKQFHNLTIRFPSDKAVKKAGLQFAPAETRAMAQLITANGVIDYDQTQIAHLSIPVQGIVYRVDRHLGERVQPGDILALVESAEVGKAKSDFQQYMVLVDIKKKIYEQLNPSVSPSVKIQEAEAALREARIHLYNAQQTLINLGLPARLEDFTGLTEAKLVEKVRVLGLPDTYASRLDMERTSANLIPLKAPFAGIVIGRDMVKGEVVNSNRSQFTVADIRQMWTLLDVRLEDTPALRLGQEVIFQADGVADESATGRINWISTEADEKTRTVRVRAEVENPAGRLRANTFGTGRILVKSLPQTVAVPDDAIQVDESCQIVFVRQSETSFQSRLVRVGLHNDKFTQIVSGVSPGEVVVTAGSHALKSEILKSRIGGEE